MTPLSVQLFTFGLTVGTGVLLGFFLDFYRVNRSRRKWKKWCGHVADLLIWCLATVIVFGILLYSNWGEVRVHVFLGLGLGFFLYLYTISRFVIAFYRWLLETLSRFWAFCGKALRFTARLVAAPVVLVGKLVFFPVRLLQQGLTLATRPFANLFRGSGRHLQRLGCRVRDRLFPKKK